MSSANWSFASVFAGLVMFVSVGFAQDDFPLDPPRISTSKAKTPEPPARTDSILSPVASKGIAKLNCPDGPPSEILKYMNDSLSVVADERKQEEVRSAFRDAFENILAASEKLLGHPSATPEQKNTARHFQASVLYQGARMRMPNYREQLQALSNSLYNEKTRSDEANLANFLLIKARHETDAGLQFAAMDDIKDYLKKFPREEASIDLLIEMATTSEIAGKNTDALVAYDFIKTQFPRSEIAKKIPKVVDRLRLVGKPFAMDEIDLNGNRITFADSGRQNATVAIIFWATWCKECMPEIAVLKDLKSKYELDGFEVIGVALDENRNDVSKFLKDNGITWRQIDVPSELARKGQGHPLAEKLGVFTLPTTLLIDRGVVKATNIRGAELRAKVAELVGRPAPMGNTPRITSAPGFDEPPPPK